MIEISPAIVALVPIIIGLTSVAKLYLDSKWAPLIALALGIGGAFFIPASTVAITILSGIVVGLTASGLYAGTKAVVAGFAPQN